jgi:hypothetical protein
MDQPEACPGSTRDVCYSRLSVATENTSVAAAGTGVD